MSIQGFCCPKCSAMLFMPHGGRRGGRRPVCRVPGCGAQMKPVNAKVPRASKMAVQQFNKTHGEVPRNG